MTIDNRSPVDVDLGEGDDQLVATVYDTLSNVPADWRVGGGAGADEVSRHHVGRFPGGPDAGRHRVGIDGPALRNDVIVSLPGFEDFSAEADTVRITGSRRGERLTATGCDVRITGGPATTGSPRSATAAATGPPAVGRARSRQDLRLGLQRCARRWSRP